jgi:hypothetical protein
MDESDVDSQLSLIEAQLAFLHAASLADDPTELPPALAELQPMLVDLSHTLRDPNSIASHSALVQNRLKKNFAMVSALREGVIRQSVNVDRAVAALVPTAQSITYGTVGSALGHQPYGMAARQSGEFKMISV